jgi:hypothetical protein
MESIVVHSRFQLYPHFSVEHDWTIEPVRVRSSEDGENTYSPHFFHYVKRPEYVWKGRDEVGDGPGGPGNGVSKCVTESGMRRCVLGQYYFVAIQ